MNNHPAAMTTPTPANRMINFFMTVSLPTAHRL